MRWKEPREKTQRPISSGFGGPTLPSGIFVNFIMVEGFRDYAL